MSFETVVPPSAVLLDGTLAILTNAAPPAPSTLLTFGEVTVRGRIVYATVVATPEADGTDFQLLWTVVDTDGNVWPRTALVLCSATA
jgi:hypothetical protein